MKKHIDKEHEGNKDDIEFAWKVLLKHNKPLQRQLHEAVKIKNRKPNENLNSKSEFNGQRIQRVGLEKSRIEWDCKVCGATFNSKYNMNEHENKFHKRIKCSVCDYMSFGTTDLNEHSKNTQNNFV